MATNGEAPIAHQLAEDLEEGYRKARDSAESLTRYLDEEGHLKDLPDLQSDEGELFIGLAYELASACAEAQEQARYFMEDPQAREEEGREAARDFLSRELDHIKREVLTTVKTFQSVSTEGRGEGSEKADAAV